LNENDNVVLELSSFQLGDLKGRTTADGNPLLKPAAAVITSIRPDHLDRYSSMNEYIDDKRNIYRGQDSDCITVAGDDSWGKSFRTETKGRPLIYSYSLPEKEQSGGWLEDGSGFARLYNWKGGCDEFAELVPRVLLVPGEHQKMNLLSAALAAYGLDVKAEKIRIALDTFPGVEHRLEFFYEANGVRFYNDSAATIPEAAAACVKTLASQAPLILVTGGADKNLDFTPLVKAASKAKFIILLAGTGSEKLASLLKKDGISYNGPFDDLGKAVCCVMEKTASVRRTEGACCTVLSPGCSSFGMFLNEFDRGNKWKDAVKRFF
jgi:UDP-N-acetylmuramoylalanine--D-glutamate ligase